MRTLRGVVLAGSLVLSAGPVQASEELLGFLQGLMGQSGGSNLCVTDCVQKGYDLGGCQSYCASYGNTAGLVDQRYQRVVQPTMTCQASPVGLYGNQYEVRCR